MWWIVLVVVAIIATGLVLAMSVDGPNRKEAMQLMFEHVQFTNLKDGRYTGEWIGSTSHMRDTQIEVQVADGKVAAFKILKGAVGKDGQPVKLSKGRTIEALLQSVIDAKSLAVDVISGATVTSKTHMKAFEDALIQAAR